ncbi:3-methyl-2-oxobutanoate hydroxymethyltransferase [Nocardioides sp. CER19]|uniref:3-methyl-2-oxobutanoate hydroxymethyltransferase n=1 Tax=Nocardioides sp. CER19 TaxID=3038538 RepID=UPI0024476060|nr:3-methyl-2-oxobutanoate hydroxymethyltransferase [Nocardioides sp. CER19]MDH2416081.1 3-methyl-2-oxobutanoate hydroxymethyltransferase [Nocardioides sp. CER19]
MMSSTPEEAAPYGAGVSTGSTSGSAPAVKKVRTHHLRAWKEAGEKFTMLTSYDVMTAHLFDEAGVDTLLVGDSSGNTVMGYSTTVPVTLDEMIVMARGVTRGAKRALVIGDLPFGTYQASPEQAYLSAARLMKEAEVAAVKLEGGVEMAPQIQKLTQGGIPVCAHIGFTPQSEHTLGGYRVQGRGDAAERLLQDARAVQEAGAFAVVLEMVPGEVAARVTKELTIPTIGIGAGNETDGQVLVWQDAFGLNTGRVPRFVKLYADLGSAILDGARSFVAEVKDGSFPAPEHTF